MKVLPAGVLEPDPDASTFRHNPWADLMAALVLVGVLVGGGYALTRVAADLPLLMWLVAGPIALIVGLVLLAVTAAQIGAFRSSLTPANWLARVDRERLFLNLRSYRNRHFAGEHPTVVELAANEIATVGKVTEVRVERRGHKRRTRSTSTIELRLAGVDSGALAEAIGVERNYEEARVPEDGKRSSIKHHHVVAFVPEPGVLRIEWNAGLFAALSEMGALEPARVVDLDEALAERSIEERAAELTIRGERLAAKRILREELELDQQQVERWLQAHQAA